MADLLAAFASEHPEAIVRRGADVFVDADAVDELLSEAERRGIGVLGLDGFLVSEDCVYPALSRIADFSARRDPSEEDFAKWSVEQARTLVAGSWSIPPSASDQMSADATGRHMIVVVLERT